jgi:pilus assembly protein CpaF
MFAIEYQVGKAEKKLSSCEIDHCTIGKAAENLIVLRGWSVGKKHATIYKRAAQLFIEDHGTMSGTVVNGKPVTGEYGPLVDTDRITIGDNSLRVFLDDTASAIDSAASATAAVAIAPASIAVSPAAAEQKSATAPDSQTANAMQTKLSKTTEARRLLHSKLIGQMDLRRLDVSEMSEDKLRDVTKLMIDDVIKQANFTDLDIDLENLARDLLNEVVGLGPLEDLLADNDISEIMVNRFDEIYIEKKGRLTKAQITFSNDRAVLGAIERIVAPLGRRIDESSPMVDARLKDGSRVNAVIPPLALKGCNITIRKFSKNKLVDKDMINYGSVTSEMMQFLQIAVHHAANIIISGGTGSGKTTLLNVLSNYIPDDERIITVEDAAELQLAKPHLISLESRPPNSEGKGAVPIRELVKNCLRMRPDRIVVGECRGGEALDMLQAMNTGHDGSMTTAHANTPRDCIARLEVMTLMSGLDLPIRAIREQISSAVHMIVQQSRFPDGSRKITHITEVVGMEGDIVQLQDIFLFKQDGYDEKGKIKGKFIATGNIPDFCQDMAKRGMPVDLAIFRAEINS